MEVGELEELGIDCRDHLAKLLDCAKEFPVLKQIDKDATMTVDEWLSSLKLIEYSENFKEASFTDMVGFNRDCVVLMLSNVGPRTQDLGSRIERSARH